MEEFRFTPKNQPARHDQLRRSFVNFFYSLIVSLVVSTMQPFPVLAADDGASLLEERCSGCHPKSITTSKRKTPREWQATVSRMKHRGARLTEEEMKTLVDYLGEAFKP